MKEIEANKKSWGLLSEAHYHHFKEALSKTHSLINPIICDELGELSGKKLIHLQCNTGADTISLARMGATVTGVDLVPENIHYAKKLAQDFSLDASFIESDIMELMDKHNDKYDIVFTSEGAIGWLPDLERWGQTVASLLKDGGFVYVFDSHPFYLCYDEGKMAQNELWLRYPYFGKEPDEAEYIGGYASEPQKGRNFFWMYTVSDILNSLTRAGLHIEFFNEHSELFFDLGGMHQDDKGLYRHPFFHGKMPYTFSVKASLR